MSRHWDEYLGEMVEDEAEQSKPALWTKVVPKLAPKLAQASSSPGTEEGRKKGGKARWSRLSQAERTELARKGGKARWRKPNG